MFGEGPDNAKVVFVGEQPGDQEDLAGKPFVGPAGKVFVSFKNRHFGNTLSIPYIST